MSTPVSKARMTTLFMAGLAAALLLTTGRDPGQFTVLIAIWFVVGVAAESLWHPSTDGVTPLSMAPAAHLAAVASLPGFWGIPVVTMASLVGCALWRKRQGWGWLHCGVGTLLAATGAFGVLELSGVHAMIHGSDRPLQYFRTPTPLLVFILSGIVFLAINQMVAAVVAAKKLRITWFSAWKTVYGRETELVTSGALIMVSMLGLLCDQALGYRGILLCVMPLLFARDGSRRNIELEIAQSKVINNERLAAKGEMAAEIGHELNNFLAAISGRAQLMLRKLDETHGKALVEEAERIHNLATQMGELAKGLMDFSHREVRRDSYGLNELVEKTVEFVRPQTKFRVWDIVLHPDPAVPSVEIDPGQIQQVLLILLGRVAKNPRPGELHIRTFRDIPGRAAGIEILNPGFSPAESDPEAEHELATVQRILDRHQGRFEVESGDQEEIYRVLLPAA